MTGKPPFSEHRIDLTVMLDVLKGVRPERPSHNVTRRGLTDRVWTLTVGCWSESPKHRPSVLVCLIVLERCAAEFSRQLPAEEEFSGTPDASEDSGSSSDDESSAVSLISQERVIRLESIPPEPQHGQDGSPSFSELTPSPATMSASVASKEMGGSDHITPVKLLPSGPCQEESSPQVSSSATNKIDGYVWSSFIVAQSHS